MENKISYSNYIPVFILTFLLVISYIVDIPIIRLGVVFFVALWIIVSDLKKATCLLMYFNTFGYVLDFNKLNLYWILVISYLILVAIKGKITTSNLLFCIFLYMYSVFMRVSLYNVVFKIGNTFPYIYIISLYYILSSIEPEDYPDVISSFITGFAMTAIVGFFAEYIPKLAEMLTVDSLWILNESSYQYSQIFRYSGLSFDCNFFGLTAVVCISILLFVKYNNNSKNISAMILAVFFIICGFATYSKTYFVSIVFVGLLYVLRLDSKTFKRYVSVMLITIIYFCLDFIFEWGFISSVLSRFNATSNFNELTTGRLHLWLGYLEYIFKNGTCIVFGNGPNSSQIGVAAHNTYIELLYKFGSIGVLLWGIFFKKCYNVVKIKTNNIECDGSFVPLIVFMIYIFTVNSLTLIQFSSMLCVCILSLRCPTAKNGLME